MKKILIGSRNPGKILEFKNFLSVLSLYCVSPDDLGIKEDVEETGSTYAQNSKKKALFYAKISGLPTIADDGGLEIEALGGLPGVKSRRWLGYHASDEELMRHMEKIAKSLGENERTAYFKTVVSFALPSGKVYQAASSVKGIIAKKPCFKILSGYPFRSFFYLPEIKKYYHEDDLSEDEQKLYNHRYKAIQKILPIIKQELSL
jgi:XTP/dITP diphosphohydrolase